MLKIAKTVLAFQPLLIGDFNENQRASKAQETRRRNRAKKRFVSKFQISIYF